MFDASSPIYALYEQILKRRFIRGYPLKHVAIIQDGNRRFARLKGMPSYFGHMLGAETTDKVSDWCIELGIKHLTVYAFSIENFNRDESEKAYIFDLIKKKLLEMCTNERIHKNRVRVRAIGRIDLLPDYLQEAVKKVEDVTRSYSRNYFNIALAYGGQCELVDAARALAYKVREGTMSAEDVDEDVIARYLYPHDDISIPEVDLIIRTGGEIRTSNFLPWQANGNECAAYFCAPYWPEFRKVDFIRAVLTAQARKPAMNQ